MNEYNTGRPYLILKEYGRNVQKLVNHITAMEDKEKRSQHAHTLVDLMKQINPAIKEGTEFNQKMWDDLIIISDFKLDVESPYPKPDEEVLTKKPLKVDYNNHKLKYKHYGRNIELLIEQAVAIEDEQKREDAIIYLGRLMRGFYGSWNKEVVDESVIAKHIEELSKGELKVDIEKVKEHKLFEPSYKERPRRQSNNNSSNKRRSNKRRKN